MTLTTLHGRIEIEHAGKYMILHVTDEECVASLPVTRADLQALRDLIHGALRPVPSEGTEEDAEPQE